jgi:hypothetical protein
MALDNEQTAIAFSSLGSRSKNEDGTVRIRCFQCREYIASTNPVANFNGALCIRCQRVNAGLEPLPEDADYKTIYVPGMGDVLESAIFQKTPQIDPMIGDVNVAPTTRINYMRRVLSTLNKTIVGKIIKPKEPESRKVARQKKQTRVFADGIELNDKPE